MQAKTSRQPRRASPELEIEQTRPTSLGYEVADDRSIVRCLAHGFPTSLARWHYHDEYELHLIVATSGKAFVGDWIGHFQPGHLVLCGPRLPHNWISSDCPPGGVAERDFVMQFQHEPIAQAASTLVELAEVLPLLERSRHGIEFFGLGDRALSHWNTIRHSRGLHRFAAFCEFLAELTHCTDFRLLSSIQVQGRQGDEETEGIAMIMDRIARDDSEIPSAEEAAADLGMSLSQFSRSFRRSTGNLFTDFVNQVRVSRACRLLVESDKKIADVCYQAGFNNLANFNRRFLEVKGMTPSEYRRQSASRFGFRL